MMFHGNQVTDSGVLLLLFWRSQETNIISTEICQYNDTLSPKESYTCKVNQTQHNMM